MHNPACPRLRRASVLAIFVASAGLLAGCATPEPKGMVHKPRSKEYFSESEYGVKASPYAGAMRLVGRNQVGKPYQVRGKWYYPKEYKTYSKVGTASWYGDAFHGRLTANGEVYNVSDLTAAHPTMPLPSYARVTNLANGSSVIVRVNDRGPFHDGRLIDLSQRAARMLGYANSGTAKVKVDYVGRAPLAGDDQSFLMASYRPGDQAPDPSDGLPTGVMVAMNGPTPSARSKAPAFPGKPKASPLAEPAPPATVQASQGDLSLPDLAPAPRVRPGEKKALKPAKLPFAMASLSYADERVSRAAQAFSALDGRLSSDDVISSWKRLNPQVSQGANGQGGGYVAVGTFSSGREARRIASALSRSGRVDIQRSQHDGNLWYSVSLHPGGHGDLDTLLQAAWSQGATDALTVRD